MVNVGLHGRVALVTGATQGIGRRVARLFAAEGAWIAVNYFADNRGAKSLIDEIRSEGGRAMLAVGSVRDAEGAWKVARHIELEWAHIDILVHAAAILGGDEAAPDATPLLAELLPGMQERGWGRLVSFNQAGNIFEPHYSGILINLIRLPAAQQTDQTDEAAARLALFLGSDWNMCVTDHTFVLGDYMAKERSLDAR
jgi:NAD(P)-dependent dehydrogenase (short-subunit alcohol dehydrogenase family)